MTKAIIWLAAVLALLSGMVSGALGSRLWIVAVLAGLIMVRRSWPKKNATDDVNSEQGS